MRTEPELLNERLDRLAIVLDEIMPSCAELVRDALELLKEQPKIVHCKDCLWNSGTEEKPYCQHHGASRNSNWFCASAEKNIT